MDYFQKLERALKFIGDDQENIEASCFHLKQMLIHCNKQPHEIVPNDIISYLSSLDDINSMKQASYSLRFFYIAILRKNLNKVYK